MDNQVSPLPPQVLSDTDPHLQWPDASPLAIAIESLLEELQWTQYCKFIFDGKDGHLMLNLMNHTQSSKATTSPSTLKHRSTLAMAIGSLLKQLQWTHYVANLILR